MAVKVPLFFFYRAFTAMKVKLLFFFSSVLASAALVQHGVKLPLFGEYRVVVVSCVLWRNVFFMATFFFANSI